MIYGIAEYALYSSPFMDNRAIDNWFLINDRYGGTDTYSHEHAKFLIDIWNKGQQIALNTITPYSHPY